MRGVLVTGFTGRLGERVATTLRDRHAVRPRVLVRPHHLTPDWQPPEQMEVWVGDFEDAAALDAALEGVGAVFLVSPVHPDMRRRELALAEQAALRPDPPRIVKISGLGTRLDSFVDSGRWHAEIEQGIRQLELPATFLRPLFFMQNLGLQLAGIRESGVVSAAVEAASIAMVDARDVADVAAAVLAGDRSIEGDAATLTGPRSLTYDEIADELAAALGHPVRYERKTSKEVETLLARAGMPDWHRRILLQFNEAFLQGWGSAVSDTVSRVLGREPRGLDAYLAELTREG